MLILYGKEADMMQENLLPATGVEEGGAGRADLRAAAPGQAQNGSLTAQVGNNPEHRR